MTVLVEVASAGIDYNIKVYRIILYYYNVLVYTPKYYYIILSIIQTDRPDFG